MCMCNGCVKDMCSCVSIDAKRRRCLLVRELWPRAPPQCRAVKKPALQMGTEQF